MAAIPNSKHHHRNRSSSDPFSDPNSFSYSSYGVPTLSKTTSQPRRVPPLPPKVPPKSTSHRYQQPVMATAGNITEELRDVPTIRHVDTSNPRTRVARSQTQLPPVSPSRPAPAPPRRSASQDSSPNNADKAKVSSKGKPTAKKGSSHADVIDRLDFSGVGPMFHHDGPFDACAPSRNRHRTKAPMFAWSGASDADRDAFSAAREISGTAQNPRYPTTSVYVPYEPPKKKRDAIAEAWGIHEPEPFEDFSAGGAVSTRPVPDPGNSMPSSRGIYNGNPRRTKDAREAREKYKEYLDDAPPPTAHRRLQHRRPNIPPPQPIFVPETESDANPPSPTQPASPSGAPKRSKSLMHRIRKMRDAPNVPPTLEEPASGNERDGSPSSSAENSGGSGQAHTSTATRPTHRAQNSFLGRLGRGPNGGKDLPSPTSDTAEPYAYVNELPAMKREKSLPATPGKNGEYSSGAYFDASAGAGGGLGRKASLLKKMKGVVKGTAPK